MTTGAQERLFDVAKFNRGPSAYRKGLGASHVYRFTNLRFVMAYRFPVILIIFETFLFYKLSRLITHPTLIQSASKTGARLVWKKGLATEWSTSKHLQVYTFVAERDARLAQVNRNIVIGFWIEHVCLFLRNTCANHMISIFWFSILLILEVLDHRETRSLTFWHRGNKKRELIDYRVSQVCQLLEWSNVET